MKKTHDVLFSQTAPDRLELKRGGGCIGCFGIPFFLAGIFMLLAVMQIIPFSNADEIPWFAWIILSLMGFIFSGVGAGLVFGRNWISIDKTRHRIWKAWGLLRPMKGEQYDLSNYTAVILSHNPGDSDSPESFPVTLQSAHANTELELNTCQTYGTSRQQAMLLAAFLNLPFLDKSTDHRVVLKPAELTDKPQPLLQEKEPGIAPRPEIMKCLVTEDGQELLIRIPGPAFSPFHLIGLLIPILIMLFIGIPLVSFFERTQTPAFVSWFFLGFIGLFFILLPILELIKAFILSRSYPLSVKVSPRGIDLQGRLPYKKVDLFIPLKDIVGIDYGTRDSALHSALSDNLPEAKRHLKQGGVSDPYGRPPWWFFWMQKAASARGIVIKTTSELQAFGQALPDAEIYHLYTLVRYYLNLPAAKPDHSSQE